MAALPTISLSVFGIYQRLKLVRDDHPDDIKRGGVCG